MVQRDFPGIGVPGEGTGKPTRGKKSTDVVGVKQAITAFHDAFVKAYGAKPTWGVKNAAIMKRLVKEHGLDEVLRRIEVLFERGLGRWPEPPYTIAVLSSQFDRLVASVQPQQQRASVKPSDVLGKVKP